MAAWSVAHQKSAPTPSLGALVLSMWLLVRLDHAGCILQVRHPGERNKFVVFWLSLTAGCLNAVFSILGTFSTACYGCISQVLLKTHLHPDIFLRGRQNIINLITFFPPVSEFVRFPIDGITQSYKDVLRLLS